VEELGGIVKSRNNTYRIEVIQRQPPRGTVWTEAQYETSVFNEATGEKVFAQRFRMRPENTKAHLREWVNGIKDAAARDAY
jgi:hypothetical protein